MPSYIEAGALLLELNDTDIFDTYNDYSMVFDTIDNFPAADVEPVRHGHWISQDNNIFKCSKCDYEFEHEGYIYFFNFCPNCGAKMDGGEGNERKGKVN